MKNKTHIFLIIAAIIFILPARLYSAEIVWPPPPEEAKISFVQAFSAPEDLKIKKSIFKKIWEFIIGEDVENRIVKPYGIFASKDEKIYITDSGSRRVHIFDLDKKKYSFIDRVRKDEFFTSPIGVAVDDKANVYVSDSVIGKVFVFDEKGKIKAVIGEKDTFSRPAGIAISPVNNYLYVVDTSANKIKAFSFDGKHIFEFGQRGKKDGEFNFPTNIAIDKDGNIYVCDTLNFRVQIFSKDGKFIGKFGKVGNRIGEFSKPKGIAVDSDGHIYVADAMYDVVQVFNKNGELMLVFGGGGSEDGKMWLPAGLYIGKDDKIYLADSYNNRVQVFKYLKGK